MDNTNEEGTKIPCNNLERGTVLIVEENIHRASLARLCIFVYSLFIFYNYITGHGELQHLNPPSASFVTLGFVGCLIKRQDVYGGCLRESSNLYSGGESPSEEGISFFSWYVDALYRWSEVSRFW